MEKIKMHLKNKLSFSIILNLVIHILLSNSVTFFTAQNSLADVTSNILVLRDRANSPRPTPPPNALRPMSPIFSLSSQKANEIAFKVPGLSGYTNLIKVLIDFRDKNKPPVVHFLNVHLFQYHYYYANEILGYNGSTDDFNAKNYSGPANKRDFVLGSIVINFQSPQMSPSALFELFTGDDMDGDSIKYVIDLVNQKLINFQLMKFHPLSVQQEEEVIKSLDSNDYILTKELSSQLSYFAFNKGRAVGYLRFITKADYESGKQQLSQKDIAVFDQVPNDIGLVAGVITQEMQTALSHINVKSINRGTINVYQKDINELRKYQNKPVILVATQEKLRDPLEIQIKDAENKIKEFWDQHKKITNSPDGFLPDSSFNGKYIDLGDWYSQLPSKAQHERLIKLVGAKAANLALVNYIVKLRNLPVKVPHPYAIPFNLFHSYWKQPQPPVINGIADLENTLEDNVKSIMIKYNIWNADEDHPIERVSPALAEIRDLMQKAKVPEEIYTELKTLLYDHETSPFQDKNNPEGCGSIPRVRFRSSTNSEDMEGFTGAGLYESKGIDICKGSSKKGYDRSQKRSWKKIREELEETIPFLFSSIFNDRAFMERELFGVRGESHLLIRIGLLIHEAFPNKIYDNEKYELANGVVISTDPFTDFDPNTDIPKIFLNFQHYDLSITNPPEKNDLIDLGENPDSEYFTEERMITTYFEDNLSGNNNTWKYWPMEKRRQTSIKNGEDVLVNTNDSHEALTISYTVKKISEDMAKVFGHSADDFPIDTEFKILSINGKRVPTIKQARPFVRPTLPKDWDSLITK